MIHKCIKAYYLLSSDILPATIPAVDMPRKPTSDHQGTLNIRAIPKDIIYRLKMAAAAEHRTVKGFILALIEERIQELEQKGILPKMKGK